VGLADHITYIHTFYKMFDTILDGDLSQPAHGPAAASDVFKSYIGAQIIKAQPMAKDDFTRMKGETPDPNEENAEGYLVEYPDYLSWSPKNVFEGAYREISRGEKDLI
jgi:hypothetical protein